MPTALTSRISIFALFLAAVLSTAGANDNIFVAADVRADPYQLFHENMQPASVEVPDCVHSEFGQHITQQFDAELGEDVFAFHLHTEHDNDRCMVFDRQRTEVATFKLSGREEDIRTYQWRFKLPEDYLPSTFWNHIFQLRPIDPVPGGNPIFTFSLLSGETEELLFYQDAGDGMKVLHREPLAPFKGRWIEARVRAKFSLSGFIEVELRSVLDGNTLLHWTRDDINLWRDENTLFVLAKWGNYRSLLGDGPLRDEVVLYNDFCVIKEGGSCERLKQLRKIISGISASTAVAPTGSINPFPIRRQLGNDTASRILHSLRAAVLAQAETTRPATEESTSTREKDPSTNTDEHHAVDRTENSFVTLRELFDSVRNTGQIAIER